MADSARARNLPPWMPLARLPAGVLSIFGLICGLMHDHQDALGLVNESRHHLYGLGHDMQKSSETLGGTYAQLPLFG